MFAVTSIIRLFYLWYHISFQNHLSWIFYLEVIRSKINFWKVILAVNFVDRAIIWMSSASSIWLPNCSSCIPSNKDVMHVAYTCYATMVGVVLAAKYMEN